MESRELIACGVAEVRMLVLPQVGDEQLGGDGFLGHGHTIAALEAHLSTLQSGLAQALVKLTLHPETGGSQDTTGVCVLSAKLRFADHLGIETSPLVHSGPSDEVAPALFRTLSPPPCGGVPAV